MTNDFEARTIIMSCVMIMYDYLIRNDLYSFGFVAAPDAPNQPTPQKQNYPNKRFRFYRRMMLSLFGPNTFLQGYDLKNSLYLLINKKSLMKETFTIEKLENKIAELYEGEYTIEII